MTKRLLSALLACLAIAALATSCGGGDDTTGGGGEATGAETSAGDTTAESTEASGSAPTKAVFIKEADEICRSSNAEMANEFAAWAKENGVSLDKEPTEEQQIAVYEEVVLPNIARQGEEIAALTPPEGDEETVEAITDALAKGVEEAEADPQQLVDGENPLSDASRQARDYGMKVCGSE